MQSPLLSKQSPSHALLLKASLVRANNAFGQMKNPLKIMGLFATILTCHAESVFINSVGKYKAPKGPLTIEIFEPKKNGPTGYDMAGKAVWLEKEYPGISIRKSKAFIRKEIDGKIVAGTIDENCFIGSQPCGFIFQDEDKVWFYDGLKKVVLFQFYPRPAGIMGCYENLKRFNSDKDPSLISRAPIEIQTAIAQNQHGG